MAAKDKKKYLTFMIVPHSEGPVHRICIPWLWIQVAGYLLVGLVLLVSYFSWDYRRVKSHLPELYRLKEINRKQQAEIENLADQATELQERLSEMEELEQRVRELLGGSASAPKRDRPATVLASRSGPIPSAHSRPRGGSNRGGQEVAATIPAVTESLDSIEVQVGLHQENLEEMLVALERRQAYLDAKPSIWPTRGRLTSGFGYRRSPFTGQREFHQGVDISAPTGTPVVATGAGVVTFTGWRSGYGRTVIIDHGYGLRTLYAHNSRIKVQRGMRVKKGQVIAYVGSTGRSTGPHVHYEVHLNGRPQNPMNYLP